MFTQHLISCHILHYVPVSFAKSAKIPFKISLRYAAWWGLPSALTQCGPRHGGNPDISVLFTVAASS